MAVTAGRKLPKGETAMTDLRDRPASAAHRAAPTPNRDTAPVPPQSRAGTDQWLLAALLLGAGVIHVAMAPSHLGESAIEGAGFLAAAWVQLALGVVVLLRAPSRRLLLAVAATSVVLIAVWLVSRTAGLPFGAHAGHAESVSVVDGVCVGLAAVAALVAAAMLAGLASGLRRSGGVAVVGVLGAVAFTTAAVASPAARGRGGQGQRAQGPGR